ncbi:MAG: hypothetical protein AAFZ74_19330 [Pseudomonadota bacterium]
MLLRRITKHVKDQNWFAVALDFMIVVIGVFIGLQVANWNDSRVERVELVDQLSSLHAEFSENLIRFETYGDQLDGQIKAISNLRRIVAEDDQEFEAAEIDRQLMAVIGIPVFTVDRTTLDELAANGAFRELSEYELRAPLVAWGQAFQALRRIESDSIEQRNNTFIPYVIDELSFGAAGETYAYVRNDIAASPFRNSRDMLRGNRKFDNLLVLRLGTISASRAHLNALYEQTQTAITQLEAKGFGG